MAVVMGEDFNCTLRDEDRSKPRKDRSSDELRSILGDFFLHDAGGASPPQHTWMSSSGASSSRIDMFLLTPGLGVHAYSIQAVHFSDHHMVTVSLVWEKPITAGRGLWKMNTSHLQDPQLLLEAIPGVDLLSDSVRSDSKTLSYDLSDHQNDDCRLEGDLIAEQSIAWKTSPLLRQKLKLCKPVVRTSKKWTSEAMEDLRACLDCTDWDVFRTATNSLDEYTEAVTSYISFCEDSCVPSRTRVSYNNDKPWFTAKLRQLMLAKEEALNDSTLRNFNSSSQKTTQPLSGKASDRSPTTNQKPPTPLMTCAWPTT
ncbi:uncharacterized protein LOC118235201 isoform X2 [Anguilla anguilla]|uniref:uncharacterized protein LOC118235201 isoform X2 n=1 Tax=Anguilla anguilla TaxID=7936 RepID=UPI0015ADAE50|nr:uncharacterized protein LOC118235201 isoform X2 [Anguilla anguilla]